MTVYSYSPPSGNKAAKILTSVLVGTGLLFMIASALMPDLDPILKTIAFALMMASVLVCTRYMLVGYTYSIESGESGCRIVGWGIETVEFSRLEKNWSDSSGVFYFWKIQISQSSSVAIADRDETALSRSFDDL